MLQVTFWSLESFTNFASSVNKEMKEKNPAKLNMN